MRLKQIHGVAVENLPTADGQNFDPAKFKLLLNHRKVELAGAGVTPPPTFPFLGGFNPAVFGLGGREGGEGGLDLRYKTLDDDMEEDMSDGGSDKKDPGEPGEPGDQPDDKAEERKSRRKPAAPQWVNPDWDSEGAGGEEGRTGQEPINGVCVRNIAAFGEENSENIAEDEAS